LAGRFTHPHSCFLALELPHLLSSPFDLPPLSRLRPPSAVMASDLLSSHLRTEIDLRKLRWVIGWQSLGFDGKMRRGVAPLAGMQLDEFIYFALYTLFGLALPFSSFLFTLLEYYGLQLQHMSPHSATLVAIFMHLYEMYVYVRPSVYSTSPLGSYYFQHRTKGPSVYIDALNPGKWDHWRED
jgi:hypothetical protein